MIFKQETVKSWFSGISTSINNEVVQPFSNAEQVIWKYNQAIQYNSLTQQGWTRLLEQSDDGLKAYLTSIKGTTASIAGYNVSLQGNITGFKKVSSVITQYNTLSASGTKEQNTFATAVSTTNGKLGTYLTGLNGAKASLGGYGVSLISSTVKTIGLTVATTALNAAMTMGISVIITGLISAFTAWINKSEEITEKAQEATDKINSISDSLETNIETIENAKKRYAELAQEVENLGKISQNQGTLSNEEYEEFLDLSNQLASIFPSLTKNYDENGNAILDLSGDVNTIVGSLDDLIQREKELANQQIMEEFPDVFKGWTQDLSDAEQQVKSAQTEFDKINQAYNALGKGQSIQMAFNPLGSNTDTDGKITTIGEYESWLETLGLTYKEVNIEGGRLVTAIGDIDIAFTSKLESAREDLQYAQQQLEGESSSINKYLNTWLQTEFSYNQIKDTGLQQAVQDMLFNFDWSTLPEDIDKNDWNAVSEYLRRNILFAINNVQDNEEISKALSEIFTNTELTPDEKVNYIKQVQDYFGEDNAITISLQPTLDDTETLQKQYDNAIEKTKDKFDGYNPTTFFKANSINTQEEVDKWLEIAQGANNAAEAEKEYLEDSTSDTSLLSFSEAFNASDFSDTKEELLELAKSGEITADVLESTEEYKALLDDTGLSAEQAKNRILGMLSATEKLSAASQGLGSLSTALDEWKEKGFVTASTLDSISDVFKGLDSYDFDLFAQIVGDPTSTEEEVKNAFNSIATEYIKTQDTLGGLTEQNMEPYIANLEDMGIANAREVVESYMESKDEQTEIINGALKEYENYLNSKDKNDQEYLSNVNSNTQTLINGLGTAYQDDYGNWTKLLDEKKKAYNAFVSAYNEAEQANTQSSGTDALVKQYQDTYGSLLSGTNNSMPGMSELQAGALANRIVNQGSVMASVSSEVQTAAQNYVAAADNAATAYKEIQFDLSTTKLDFTSGNYIGSADSSSSSDSASTAETYDWIETKITRLTEALDRLKTKMDNTYASWTSRNTALTSAISKTKEAISLQAQAYTKYMQKANSVGLSSYYKNLVQNGTLSISSISDETLKDKISEYQEWYEKALACKQTQEDLQSELKELNSQKFTNIKSEYDAIISRMQSAYDLLESQITLLSSGTDYRNLRNRQNTIIRELQAERTALSKTLNASGIPPYTEEWYSLMSEIDDLDQQIQDAKDALKEIDTLQFDNVKEAFDFDTSVLEHGIQMIQNKADLLETKGLFANESYYNSMIQYTQKELTTLTNERKQLQNILNSTLYKQGTSEWNDMYSTLMEIDEEIDSMTGSIAEYNNAIRDLNWEIFAYLEESISRITDETEYLIELLAKKDLYDETGSLTKYADAAIALYAAAYDTYKQQAQDYYEEVQDLQKQLVNGAGQEVLEQYNAMVDAHQEAVLAAEEEKQAILDLTENGYQAQLDALQKLIDKKKEQLSAEKNLYDYRKNIEEQTGTISSLEKQKLAYEGDNSEEAMSKVQQIKVQLEEARAELKETEYEQYLSDTEDMLDRLAEDYEEWMNARLDNEDALLAEIIGTVSGKGDEINATLNEVAEEYGTFISDTISSVFDSGSPFTCALTNGLHTVSTAIAGTTAAIDKLVAYVAGLTNANANKTNAGSGTAGSSSSGSSSSAKTASSSGSSSPKTTSSASSTAKAGSSSAGSGSSKTAWGSWFVKKTDTYPKEKLQKDTSIVDRLKYHNYDSAFSQRAKYYSAMGGTGTYTGSSAQNTWMLAQMKSHGYQKGTFHAAAGNHWTQEDGEEIIVRKADKAMLLPFREGDMVFNHESSRRLWELANDPEAFMQKYGIDSSSLSAVLTQPSFHIAAPDVSSLAAKQAMPNMSVDNIRVSLELPNVQDYTDFRNQLMKDSTFENAMFSSINHALTGKGTSLDKMKYTR